MRPDRKDLLTGLTLTFLALLFLAWLGQATVAISALDEGLLQGLQAWRGPRLDRAVRLLTDLGGPLVLVGLATLTGFLGWPSRAPAERLGLLATLLAGTLVNSGLKSWFARPRPGPEFSPLVQEPLASFPSGHAMLSLCVYGLLAWQVGRTLPSGARRVWLVCLLGALVAAIGLSRVYLAAHYPSDVAAGFAAGVPILWLATALIRRSGEA